MLNNYDELSPNQKINKQWVLRSPSGRVSCSTSEPFQLDKGYQWYQHYYRLDVPLREVTKGYRETEIGTYTVELYIDGQYVGAASFEITN